jgi:hypothetical protein
METCPELITIREITATFVTVVPLGVGRSDESVRVIGQNMLLARLPGQTVSIGVSHTTPLDDSHLRNS